MASWLVLQTVFLICARQPRDVQREVLFDLTHQRIGMSRSGNEGSFFGRVAGEISGPNVIKGTQSFSAASWRVSIQRDVVADVFFCFF